MVGQSEGGRGGRERGQVVIALCPLSLIDVATVANFQNPDFSRCVVNVVDDALVPHADTPFVPATRHLEAAMGSRISCKSIDGVLNALMDVSVQV